MRNNDQADSTWANLLKLLPLLLLYVLFGVFNNKSDLRGDESRYLVYAHNILNGYFASPESLMFWNGPGYPLYLAPFVAWKVPLLIPRLGNALFLYFGIAYFRATLGHFGIGKRALVYAYLMGILLLLHGPLIDLIMSESLSAFLVCGAAYHYFRLVRRDGRSGLHFVAAGIYLGYLVWTKVFFGYAVEISLLGALVIWIWSKWRSHQLKQMEGNVKGGAASGSAVAVCALALVVCIPYLAYTKSVTGKTHFWGNSGGLQLYCLTVPEKELVGDWLNFDTVRDHPDFFKDEAAFFWEMSRLDYISRDADFRKAAIRNLKANPLKCFWNWRANVNRMVFGFPVSPYPGSDKELTTGNRTFAYAFPFLVFLFALMPGLIGYRAIPAEAHAALVFALISLGGLTLLSCIPRQAFPLLPLLGLWTVLVAEKALRWEGRWRQSGLPQVKP